MSNLFDQFWAETKEVRHFHKIDGTLSEQLQVANLEIKEPSQFLDYLVNCLRIEVDEKSSSDEFFSKNTIESRLKKFAEVSYMNKLFTVVFAETYQCTAKHEEKPRIYTMNIVTVPDCRDTFQTVM